MDRKLRLRASFRYNPKGYKDIYPKSKVILLISVGQKYHEGEKLEATIDLINRSNFQQCTIMLGDSIQRHTLQINNDSPPFKIHEKANQYGTEWLLRNQKIYKKLIVPYNIIRWDNWLKHKDYIFYRNHINFLYNKDLSFKEAFYYSIEEFIKRYQKQHDFDEKKAFLLCLEYFQEECAIIMPIWAQYHYDFLIYPKKMLNAMKATQEKLVLPSHQNAFQWLCLRFKLKTDKANFFAIPESTKT